MRQEDSDTGMANSFTDLMTSLMVIFILLLCASLNNAFQEGQDTRTKILEKLRLQLDDFVKNEKNEENKRITIKIDEKDPLTLLILVPEGLLEFKTNNAEIPPDGNKFLESFIPLLTDTIYLPEFRNEISSVVVEGHTDSKAEDAYNLKLSQDRSMSVVSKCINILSSSPFATTYSEEKRNYFLDVLSASGRGERDLIKTLGVEDMDQSRRVVFKIRVRSFEEKQYKAIMK